MKAFLINDWPPPGTYDGTLQVDKVWFNTPGIDPRQWKLQTEDAIKSPVVLPVQVIVKEHYLFGRTYEVLFV